MTIRPGLRSHPSFATAYPPTFEPRPSAKSRAEISPELNSQVCILLTAQQIITSLLERVAWVVLSC